MAGKTECQHTSPAVSNETTQEQRGITRWMSSVVPPSIARQWPQSSPPQLHDRNQDYLTGLRGVLVPMAFLWTFLQTFAPAAVKGADQSDGPAYQLALRKSLSILFWNDTIIYGSIVFLSARTICLPFLLEPSKVVLASTVFRRGLRLWFPVAVALIIVFIVFTHAMDGSAYLTDFATLTNHNTLDDDLYILPSSLANFNAIFMTFWTTHDFQMQAANWAFPTQMLWVISAVFQQSYTVYMTMVIIPYTRARWRVLGAFAFILTAWWVYSWAWYSISGLLIADAVMNMGLRPGGPGSYINVNRLRVPFWMLGVLLLVAGFTMQFVWAAARPDLQNAELFYHTGIYTTGGLNTGVDVTAVQIRADCYLIILGFSLMLETSAILQSILHNKFLIFLGKRSFSYFLVQSIIIYTLGITTVTNMIGDDMTGYQRASGVAFIVTLLVTVLAAEAMHWLVEVPSVWFGRWLFDWIRK